MATITISRQYGSGGDEIVEQLCKTTGYTLFDKNVLARAAIEAGLSDGEIIDFSEENYKVKNIFDRIFTRPAAAGQVYKRVESTDGTRTRSALPVTDEQARQFVEKAIQTAHSFGNILIVGRGGQVILKNTPGVLHVRIEADLEDRLLRVRHLPEFTEHVTGDAVFVRRAAQLIIEKHDAASADYLQRFYGVDWADHRLYHLVFNTSKLSLEQAAGILLEAARMTG